MFLTMTTTQHRQLESNLATGPMDGVPVNMVVKPRTGEIMSGSDVRESLKRMVTATEIQVSPTLSDEDVTAGQNGGTVVEPTVDNTPLSVTTTQLPTNGMKEPLAENLINTPVLPPDTNDRQDTAAKGQITIDPPTATVNEVLPATTLKRRLEDTKDLLVCPGVYDGFSARIALSIGFDALYMVSSISRSLTEHASSHPPDRRRYHRLPPWTARSRPRTTQ